MGVVGFCAAALSDPTHIDALPLLHLAVGVVMTYLVLALLFNRTTVTLDANVLSLRHGPLPCASSRVLG